ncbi:MAG: hypothetical protein QF467_06715 [SAR202 cluster bacterium]|nr:hypothetical protein [SAR202 cluster bacterium]
MSGRIFLANVGVNAGHRFVSPIFPDRTFEFIPIPEDRDLPGPHTVRYRDLRSFQYPAHDLKAFIPERLWDRPTHNDPEFDTFTYGDNCGTSPRAAALMQLGQGDVLLFLAHLVEWERPGPNVESRPKPDGKHGFYLVGLLDIEEVIRDVRSRPTANVFRRVAANAHVRRGLSQPGLWDGFWVFCGSDRSRRFHRAVPVTRDFAARVFTSADGSPWRWDNGRTDLQVIGSYTRSCRCVIDPAQPGHEVRAGALWEWVKRYST